MMGMQCEIDKNEIAPTVGTIGKIVVSRVGNICAAIGGSWFVGMSGIAPLIAGIIGVAETFVQVVEIVQTVTTIVKKIPKKTDVKPDMNPYELGLKAETANRSTDEFENVKEYIDYLRDEVKIDSKKIRTLSDEDKVYYGMIGTGIYIKEIEEEYDIYTSGEFWRTVADMNLRGEDVKTYIKIFKDNGIKDMSEMSNYIKGKKSINGTDSQRISDSLLAALRLIYPNVQRMSCIKY